MAATRIGRSLAILFFEIPDRVGKAPLVDVDGIVAGREDAAAADLLAWSLYVILVAQPFEQLVHDPARHHVALARIDEAEVEKRYQQHFPIELHVAEKLLPVDRLMALQDHVRDVRPVEAVMILDEDLRPNELRRRDEPDLRSEHLGLRRADEPFVG